MNEIQKELFEVLCAFDDLCQKHGLHYQLAYGTLLGAVRHKGFIPWDDDVDVFMPLGDYERLRSISFGDSDFFLQDIKTDRTYFYPFPKFKKRGSSVKMTEEDIRFHRTIGGAWLDIFPMIPIVDIHNCQFSKS